jgi:hypothetical protein
MKENKRKQKSESFDQGKFVPNVLDKVYSQLGISANQEKVSPEDEQRILSLFAKEANAFVPNVLPAVKAKAHVIAPEDRIDPAAEAKIIGMLAAEASAFVPNVLPAVAKAEKIELAQEKLSPLEEKKVVKAIQKEASVFVPNDLSALEQICGTVKVNETQEALELNEKMKNEAGAFLAPSENRVYAQAGLKKRGFFAWLLSTKGIAISSGVVAATAAAVTLAIVLNTGSSATLLPAAGAVTVVNVAVTPASATTTTTTTSGVKAVLKAATTTTSANTYTPKASYQVDAKGLADSTTFTPKNYSGTLAFIAPSNTEAPAFSSSLLSSAYSKGYLETKDATKDNVITLRIISSDLRYNNTNVQNLYRTAMDNYLKSQKIYAAIEFDDTADINSDLNAFMAKGNDSSLTNQIYEIYDKLMSETHITDYANYQSGTTSYAHAEATSFATYAELLAADSAEFRTKLNGYLTTIVTGAFSDTGLQYVLNATDLIYKAYKGQISVTSPVNNERMVYPYMEMISRITQNLNYLNPTYYYSSTVDANDYKPVTSLPDPHSLTSADLASAIQAVRDYYIASNTKDEENVIELIRTVKDKAANQTTEEGLPDPYRDHRDDGHHDHGDGPKDPNWGGGGDRHDGDDDDGGWW